MKVNIQLNIDMALSSGLLLLSNKIGCACWVPSCCHLLAEICVMPTLFPIANVTLRRYFAFLRIHSSPGQKTRSRGVGVPTCPVLLSVQVTRKQLHGGTIPER